MPCANTSWTGPQVAKSLVIPCAAKARGRSPEILVPPYAGFWGHTDPYLPRDLATYTAREPRDKQGRPPGRGPPTPHQQGTPNPKWGEPSTIS